MASQDTLIKVNDSSIIVSFNGAKSPSVWRASLSRIDDAVFKVDSVGKNKYVLILAKPGAVNEELAEFTTKAAATDALSALTNTLFDLDTAPAAEAIVTTQTPKAIDNEAAILETPLPEHKMRRWKKIYWVTFGVLFILVAAIVLIGALRTPPNPTTDNLRTILPDRPTNQTMGGDVEDLPDVNEGRPMSADDYFGQQN